MGILSPPAVPWAFGAALTLVLVFSWLLARLLLDKLAVTKAPPVFGGFPLIGGLLKFAGWGWDEEAGGASQGPIPLMRQGYAACGEVFTIPLLHKKVTFLLGPHVSHHFFKATDDELSQKEVYQFNVPTFGRGVVFDVDHKTRAEQFRFFADALKGSRMQAYVPHFVREAEDFFGRWGDEGVVDLKEQLSELIILTASRTLMGREVRDQMFARVAQLFHDLDAGMLPISVLFPYLPIPAHARRDRAREALKHIFAPIIRQRRKGGALEEDVLQSFIEARYRHIDGGRPLTEDEITGLLIAVLFAGQHTSSITSCWTGFCMLTHPATLEAALEEQRSILRLHGKRLDMQVLGEMELLQRNISEALRLFPPLILLMRQVKADFSVTSRQGRHYVIPKGHIVMASPQFSHRLEHVFAEPDTYNPDRFAPGQEVERGLPFSYIAFGGGRHGCMGTTFAYLQIKTIWSILLREFELEMVDPFPEPDFQSMVVGPKPCRVRFRRRKQPLC